MDKIDREHGFIMVGVWIFFLLVVALMAIAPNAAVQEVIADVVLGIFIAGGIVAGTALCISLLLMD